jgi:hypothetical protein
MSDGQPMLQCTATSGKSIQAFCLTSIVQAGTTDHIWPIDEVIGLLES